MKISLNKKKTVFVGVSGGVDSSVSAAILKDQGYNVVGVFIRTWSPDFIDCTWQTERRDAMRVCAHLDIPFLECDAENAYKTEVAMYMIEEYKNGRTPNPDVMCNREVKFGVFWEFAKRHGADYIATGHYAVNNYESGINNFKLKQSPDKSKDQSYFLWTLTQEDLSHALFPIGHLQKTEVRKLANKYKLPVATKKDSQGVCFLGPLDMKDFLKHYIDSQRGNVLNEKGEIIGHHDGAIFFTLGERHGFTLEDKKGEKDGGPLYVTSKNINDNTITVSHKFDLSFDNNVGSKTIICDNSNWISVKPEENKVYTAQIRYHGEFLDCNVSEKDENVKIIFNDNILVDKGQSIVIYENDVCLGGAIVR